MKKFDKVVLSIVTILVLSTWGPALLNIGGFYVPEIIIFLLAVYLYVKKPKVIKDLKPCVLSKAGFLWTLWLLFVTILGVLRVGSLNGPYSELRASLILVYAFIFMYKNAAQQSKLFDLLLWISFSVLCLDSLLVLFHVVFPGYLSQPASNEMEVVNDFAEFGFGRVTIPAINILVSAYLSSRAQRISMLFFIIFLGVILSMGGHRVILLTTAISSLFVPICLLNMGTMQKLKNRWIKIMQISLYISLIVIFIKSDMVQNYLSLAQGIQNRLFNKTADTFEGVISGLSSGRTIDYGQEGIRAAYISYLIDDSPWLLLPHGLGSRETYGKLGYEFDQIAKRYGALGEWGNTHDLTILYLAYHQGLLITCVLMGGLIFLTYRRLKFAEGNIDRAYVLTALLGIVAIDLAGAPVPGINIAFPYAMFLGLLMSCKCLKYQQVNRTRINV